MKACRQCGEVKQDNMYRQYYNGSESRNLTCMQCEKINSRRKYLERKEALHKREANELQLIYQLYEQQRANGLRPPKKTIKEVGLVDAIQGLLNKQAAANEELQGWLDKPLTEYTPDQLDDIYDNLKEKYRAMRGLDPATLLPIYDETYKIMLDKVLVRFDDYEEEYYNEDDYS